MAESVCCPNCWSWSDASARTSCRRCGTPLIRADGRRLDAALSDPPPPPPPPGGFQPPMPPGFSAPAVVGTSGTDWVAICRWITIGYGLLTALALILIGLLIQHINVPITDPSTGITTVQTFNIGPAFAIAAVVVGGVTALCAWLTQYSAARVVFLLIDAISLLSVFSGAGTSARLGGFGVAELVTVAVDLVYAGALVMSFVSRPQPAYS